MLSNPRAALDAAITLLLQTLCHWRRASERERQLMKRKPIARKDGRRIKANLSTQRPTNSYSPPLYYEDKRFTCRDCGAECVWTAEQQQLWYERWGGPVQSTAIRCRACR